MYRHLYRQRTGTLLGLRKHIGDMRGASFGHLACRSQRGAPFQTCVCCLSFPTPGGQQGLSNGLCKVFRGVTLLVSTDQKSYPLSVPTIGSERVSGRGTVNRLSRGSPWTRQVPGESWTIDTTKLFILRSTDPQTLLDFSFARLGAVA